ncbi:MAG: hypothetical protein SNF93_04765 [Rikenellaceae bacterium]
MKDFDLEKIGRKMPYEAPGDKFFENFTDELLAKVAAKPKKRMAIVRTLTPFLSAAALIALVVTVSLRGDMTSSAFKGEYIISENLDESIDSFFNSLSDDELSVLIAENSYHDDFYSNLPTE